MVLALDLVLHINRVCFKINGYLFMCDTVLELNGETPAVTKPSQNGDENMTPFEINLKDKRYVCMKAEKDMSLNLYTAALVSREGCKFTCLTISFTPAGRQKE